MRQEFRTSHDARSVHEAPKNFKFASERTGLMGAFLNGIHALSSMVTGKGKLTLDDPNYVSQDTHKRVKASVPGQTL